MIRREREREWVRKRGRERGEGERERVRERKRKELACTWGHTYYVLHHYTTTQLFIFLVKSEYIQIQKGIHTHTPLKPPSYSYTHTILHPQKK